MKQSPRRWLRFCAVLIACLQYANLRSQDPVLPGEPERPKITRIEIKHLGPPAVSDDLIRGNIRIRQGDPYNKVSVDDDIRNLYTTGYFYNIRVVEEPVGYLTDAQGTPLTDVLGRPMPKAYTLTYVVQGKPLLTEIRFTGNRKYSKNKLLKKVKSKVGEPLDEQKLFTDAQEIQKLYQKAGLQRTTVTNSPVITESLGRGTVTFEIVESPKTRINDVVFENARAFPQKKLRKTIKTRRHWMFSWLTGSGKLKEDQFEEDKEKLREFYADHGYVDYELKGVKLNPVKPTETNRIVLELNVEEGTQYKVGGVEFKGNQLYPTNTILSNLRSPDGDKVKSGLRLKDGSVFSPKDLEKDDEAIRDFYGSRGYIDARVDSRKNANIDKGTIDLVHNIREGEKSYVEKIEIRGNTKTKDRVIRRELAIGPGETFDMLKVKASKSILEQMQYFEKVDTTTDDTDVPNRKNLIVAVEEKNTGNIALGAGFSSVDAVVGFVEISQGNFDLFNPPYFTGAGQKARLRAQFGTKRKDYVATFVEPWFLGRRLELTTELFHRELNYYSDNYEQVETGARLALRKALPHHFEIGGSYTLETVDINLSDSYRAAYGPFTTNSAGQIIPNPNRSEIVLEQGQRLVSKVGTTVAHDTRNNFLLPSRGHRAEVIGEIAGGPLGGDTDFYKVEFRGAQYWSPTEQFKFTSGLEDFFKGHVLELSGRLGVVEAYGDGDRGRKDRVPMFDRHFLGGAYSLRGSKYREVGPRDLVSNEPLGGGTYWYGSADYSVPIIDRLRFAVFYDVGMVYTDAYSFDPKQYPTGLYNDNYGVGLRLNLPIGPLRLDYGIPISRAEGASSGGRFQFTVGYSRDF